MLPALTMAKKRTKKKSSMRPAAPDLVMSAPPDALAETVEVRPDAALADTMSVAAASELEALLAVPPAPHAPDTLAPVANDAEPEERVTMADAPSARVRVAAEPHEDVMDLAFFASGGAVEANLREEARRLAELEREPVAPSPSPQQLARRRSLQRAVGVVVAVAAAMFVAAVGVGASRGAHASQSAAPAVQPPVALAEPARSPVPAEAPATHDEVAKVAAEAPPVAATQPSTAQTAQPLDAEPAPAKQLDPAAAKELTKKALVALERGKHADAIAHAKASVDADPTDANAYLYWGTALMESGKRAEAKAVFATCVDAATRGPKHECRAFR